LPPIQSPQARHEPYSSRNQSAEGTYISDEPEPYRNQKKKMILPATVIEAEKNAIRVARICLASAFSLFFACTTYTGRIPETEVHQAARAMHQLACTGEAGRRGNLQKASFGDSEEDSNSELAFFLSPGCTAHRQTMRPS
jgi:hypothetical protein